MKTTIEKITNKAGDKQFIRLVYYCGSRRNEAGKLILDRKRKHLDQYAISKNPLQQVKGIKVVVNGNWRITYKFEGEDVVLVAYIDYH